MTVCQGLQHGAYVNITGYRETDSTHAEELKVGRCWREAVFLMANFVPLKAVESLQPRHISVNFQVLDGLLL